MAHARRTSSDDQHGAPGQPLAPPRPFFLADVQTNRSSNSSFDTTSLDPASDSDSPPELPTKPAPRLPTAAAAPYHSRTHRKRSSMSHAVYAPLSSSDKERDKDDVLSSAGEAARPTPPSRRNSATWDPASLYSELQAAGVAPALTPSTTPRGSARPPPSSFTFPFQAYPGNPDPGLAIPGVSRRRASFDSGQDALVAPSAVSQTNSNNTSAAGEVYHPLSHSGSLTDLRKPVAPFMSTGGGQSDSASSTGSLPRSASSNSLYKASAAANMMPASVAPQESITPTAAHGSIPRNASTHSFRAPFLAPSSRPTSSLWSPPSYNTQLILNANTQTQPLMSPNASTTALPTTPGFTGGSGFPPSGAYPHGLKTAKPLLPSTRLAAPLTQADKPWLAKTERGARLSYSLTLLLVALGLAAAGAYCWRGVEDVKGRMLDERNLCLVLEDHFDGSGGGVGGVDEGVWTRDVELGGFGNGQFEMTTASEENLYVRDGELWFVPTLTSDSVNNILDGGTYTLPGCTGAVALAPVVHTNSTNTNSTTSGGSSNGTTSGGGTNACTAISSAARGTAINPVMSARINTKGKKSVRFGRVEVRAKLARGDWLWPAIWMLPEDSAYGPWPASGEIDIMEARGNGIEYAAQGANYVRSGLSYGPMPGVVNRIYGWWSSKRTPYSDKFHTYTLEWDPKFIRVFVDRRTSAMLEVEIGRGRKRSFWDKAGFPLTAPNGSSQVVVTNPYSSSDGNTEEGLGTDAAPYDQKFYLVMNLAVGGTSGWFPDGGGGKPWFDESLTAMRDFARAQDEWSKTWPTNVEDRAFRVDYVKMWERC